MTLTPLILIVINDSDPIDSSRTALTAYVTQLEARFGRRPTPGQPGMEIPEWAKTKLAPTLMRSRWFTRRVVTKRWFLHEHVPALKTA